MLVRDFFLFFYWWILLFGLGILFFPLTFLLFRKFFDFGYPFSKVLSISILGYSLWLLASFKILPFSHYSIWILIFLFFFLNAFLAKKHFLKIKSALNFSKKILIFEEILFLVFLFFWAFLRGFNPQIEGLEKFMDFGFMNAILKSEFFPPYDMWMAGKTINYYYFGHYIAAFLTKLSNLDSAFTYNLMIATIFALSFVLSFSLIGNLIFHWQKEKFFKALKLILAFSLFGAFLVNFGGNLHPLWWFLNHDFSFKEYWFPDATRFISLKFGAKDDAIHEFPIYSFVVADLHGHLNDLPFVFLFLAIILSFFLEKKVSLSRLILIGLVLAIMIMTNAWDAGVYLLLFGFLVFVFSLKELWPKIPLILKKTFFFSFLSFLFALAFCLPFLINFDYPGYGIGLTKTKTPLVHLLVLWGYQWLLMFVFLLFLPKSERKISNVFVFSLCAIATILVFIPEIVYFKDIYGGAHYRANTVFKFSYQAFILYAISAGFILFFLWERIKKAWLKFFLFSLFAFFLTFVSIYPYFAIKSFYGNPLKIKNYKGIYGLSFLETQYLDDYNAVLWLKQNVKGRPGVLEAAGDSFTDFNRVSAITGLPTIQGWLVHEWLWRGSFDEVGKRAEIVRRIYETDSSEEALTLLNQYKMEYVFLGAQEYEKYQVKEEKFKQIGKIVFQSGQTKIYKIQQ